LTALLFRFNGNRAIVPASGESVGQTGFQADMLAILSLFGLVDRALLNPWNATSTRLQIALNIRNLPEGKGQPLRQTLSRPLASSS
jgi:hypothetical protein